MDALSWCRGITLAQLLAMLFVCVPALSQQLSFRNPPVDAVAAGFAIQPAEAVSAPEIPSHRFWDPENRILFAAVAATSAADFAATYSNLSNGGKELNPVTRLFSGSTAGLAFNFAGEAAGVVGISYLFHKTGHHKLERIVAMVNVGASTAAVSYDLMHR